MSVDLNAQAVAEQWASTDEEITKAEEELQKAKDKRERLTARRSTLSEQLARLVGPNSTTMIFQVAVGEIVIVEHGRPIRLLKTERTA